MAKPKAVNPRELKTGDIVLHHGTFYEVGEITVKHVHMSTFTSSPVSFGGTVAMDSPQWAEVTKPDKKADLAYIEAINRRRERTIPTMHHDAVRLPDGTVHVQNWISGMYGGSGQHHAHTAAEFETWAKTVDAKHLIIKTAEKCCELKPGQTREYNGRVWSVEDREENQTAEV